MARTEECLFLSRWTGAGGQEDLHSPLSSFQLMDPVWNSKILLILKLEWLVTVVLRTQGGVHAEVQIAGHSSA